ncbi:hypothetical protein CHR62_09975 [Pusillimonas sp. NJUB218]|nr:hypothetical protein CHR62_09975 [Pusillimonas sp. NJUB218]
MRRTIIYSRHALMRSSPTLSRPDTTTTWLVNILIAFSAIAALIPTTLAYLDPTLRLSIDFSEGSIIRQIQLSLLFLLAAFVFYTNRATGLITLRSINPFLILVFVYCLASTLWSPYPVVTIKRIVILGGLLLAGLCIAPPIGTPHQFLRTLRLTLTTILVLSFFTAIFVPHIGVDYSLGGAWRGITWQKNLLGSVATYSTLLWLYEWTTNSETRWRSGIGIAFSLFILIMAKSSTATALAVLACGLYVYNYRVWLAGRYLNLTLLLGALCIVVMFVHFYYVVNAQLPDWNTLISPIAALFDKGTDLTGRTEIWVILAYSITQHPIIGIGYGAFWLGAGSPAQFIADEFGWMPAHGHNGYLDVMNELGGVGLLLFIGFLLWHLRCILKLMKHDRPEGALHLSFLMIIAISNITETDFLSGSQFQNILLLFSSLSVSARLYWLKRSSELAPNPEAEALRAIKKPNTAKVQ